MSKNFKMEISKNGNTLKIKLKGQCDGSSVCELLNTLNEHGDYDKILIGTKELSEVCGFAQAMWEKNGKKFKNQIRYEGPNLLKF